MTHFVGLVVVESEADLASILQPFHEYECTGVDDEYVVDVDRTEEAKEAFAQDTTRCLRDAAGALHSFFTPEGNWRPEFSQPSSEAWAGNRREAFIPPGYEDVTVPAAELQDFATWARSYYGADTVKGVGDQISIISHTNPNAKWDWWTVGGRWGNIVPKNTCTVEQVANWFPDWQPSVLVDTSGWHAAKEWGWFGSSSPSETPEIMAEKMKEHAGKRVWVVDFHI